MKLIAILLSVVLPLSAGAQDNLNYEMVIKTLESHQPNTVAKALAAIKADHPASFENYMLVARSMSIQGSTPESPRAVVFDQDAKLIMTFNGQVGERGYDRLELMAFDESKKTYDFREIKFFGDAQADGTFSISGSGGAGGRCLNCHGDDALAIWDSYPFFPDYYGSFAKTSDSPVAIQPYQQKEVEAYTNFVAQAKSHERYQVLPEKSFAEITEMNSALGRALAERVRETAKLQMSVMPAFVQALRDVFGAFNPQDTVGFRDGLALPNRPLSTSELDELSSLSDYHQTKLVRYARNFGGDKVTLLDELVTSKADSIAVISKATGIAPEDKLQLWTYTQTQPADLVLLPKLRSALADQIGYLNAWSIIPGRRFIEFSHPDALPSESGIEKALSDLL